MFTHKYPYTDFQEYNLDWIINRIKQLTTEWAETKTEWTTMKADLEDLKTYILEYFDNLDVQEEINNKLDEMAADGTLLSIIKSTVEAQSAAATATWLEANITEPEGVVIDTSLTVSGACADAKVTGDEIRTALRTYTAAEITDAWLVNNNITDALLLEKGRIYILNNVSPSQLSNMPVTGTNYNGALIVFKQRTVTFSPLLYIDNQARLWTGQNIGSMIRWRDVGLNIENLLSTTLQTFPTTISDTWLSDNNITDARQLEKNKIYNFSNVDVSSIANMPGILPTTSKYNGALIVFKLNQAGFQPMLYLNNLGKLWFGQDVGSEVRWMTSIDTMQNKTDIFYNRKLLLLGDSIMYGSHMSDYAEGNRTVVTLSDNTVYKDNLSTIVWSSKLADYCTTKCNMTVTNNSFPGARFNDLVTYFDQLVTQNYNAVIICLGVNNWGTGAQVIPSLNTLYSRFKSTNTKMIVFTPLDSITYKQDVNSIQNFIKQFAYDRNMEIGCLNSEFNLLNYLHGRTLSDVLDDGVHYKDNAQDDIFEAAKHILQI